MAAALGVSARATVTPVVEQKMVWAGVNLPSYKQASATLKELCGLAISARRIRRAVDKVAKQRLQEREEAVAEYQQMELPRRQAGSQAAEPPELGVISLDGGRYQRRDHFGQPCSEAQKHWRESKVGCLLSMSLKEYERDPVPEIPPWLLHSEAVRQLAKTGEMPHESPAWAGEQSQQPHGYKAPQVHSREVLASGREAEQFGWQLATWAWQRAFARAKRLAFVADGAAVNWEIKRRHFPRAVGILDLMHALSYAYAASRAIEDPKAYERWAGWIWAGKVHLVIEQLSQEQARLGLPPPEAGENDPRVRVNRALSYYRNHRLRMNYPEYRRQGLPLTSSHIESTVKQINRRIKGTEKFWSRSTAEGVLQLRADYLSTSQPMRSFWLRYQASQTGSNAYGQST